MRDRFRWWGLVMGFVLAAAPFAVGSPEIGPKQAVEGTVRFDLYRGYLIVVRGSAGPIKGLNFLLDTGASPTVLDPGVPRKLHLEEFSSSIAVLGGRVSSKAAMVPSLSFGPIERQNLPVLIEDLSFLEKELAVRIDGVIGLDLLGKSSFLIDYSSRQIHFGPLPVLANSLPLRVAGGLATVNVEVNHSPARLLVDTGASSLMLFAATAPSSVSGLKISAVQRSTNMSGQFERKQVWLRSLKVGEAEFGQEPAFLVQDGSQAGHGFDGLMSPVALGIRRVAIDLGRGEMGFSR